MAQIFVYIQISDCCDSIEVYYDTPYMEWNNFTINRFMKLHESRINKKYSQVNMHTPSLRKKIQLLFTTTNWIGITEFDSIQDA